MSNQLSSGEIGVRLHGLQPGWSVADGPLKREFRFPDFKTALEFVNKVGGLAESMNHHPDLELGWGRVEVSLTTHSAGGLTDNDFKLAAAIDQL